MNYQKQTLLTAIKTSILHQHTHQLSIQPPVYHRKSTPFEIYQYQQQGNDYEEIENRMKEQIIWKFNQPLYEEECSKLQMELFGIEEAIQIQKNQISYLKVWIDAHKFNRKSIPSIEVEIVHKQPECSLPQVHQKAQQKNVERHKDQLSIFPCVRVDFDPPVMPVIPLLPLKQQQKQVHLKSQRQIRAIYTRRSQTHSQTNHNQLHQQKDKSIKNEKKEDDSLIGIKRQIEFMERAWEDARKQGKEKLCKKYKKELMTLISDFWKASGRSTQ